MHLVKQEMSLNSLFKFFIGWIFLVKYRIIEENLGSLEFFELDTEFGKIQDQIRSV